MSDWDDSTDDPTLQAFEGEKGFNSPPYNPEAEEAVLGSVLINPEGVLDDLADFLRQDDFYILRNGWIWQAFARLHELGQPIDYFTVINDLQEHNQLAEMGGPARLIGLINQTPSSLHAVAYGHLIEQAATCHRLARPPTDCDRGVSQTTGRQTVPWMKLNVSLRRITREVRSAETVMSSLYDQVASQANGGLPEESRPVLSIWTMC